MPTVAQIIRRRRQKRFQRREQRERNRVWNLLIASTLLLLVGIPAGSVLGGTAWLYWRSTTFMPTPAETTNIDPFIGATQLFDRSGQTLLFAVEDPLGNQRTWIALETLPPYVVSATLMMEDPDFLDVTRFDTGVTLNKLWTYMFIAPPSTDTSITGRLVRNALLPQARRSGLDDSLLEIVLTAETNRRYTPREVLEWYLNTNYYGSDAYGIEAAAQVYLGKSASQLTLDEAVLLAAIPPSPQFNPFNNEVAARGRQADLLRNLLLNGKVTQADYDVAISRFTPLRLDLAQLPTVAPEFSLYARRQAQDILDSLGMDGARLVSRGGLKITTTLDLDLYFQSECIGRTHLARLVGQNDAVETLDGNRCVGADYLTQTELASTGVAPNQATVMLMDVQTGEIKALVGSAESPIFQPGPALHPFVYFEAFRSPFFNPATMVLDIPQPFPGPADGLIYTPTNPDGKFRGPMNLRDAMAGGLLPPVVSVADSKGMSSIIASAHVLGLTTLNSGNHDLSLLERGGNVSVLDMTYAYSVFATQGILQGVSVEPIGIGYRERDPVAILKIEDANGNVWWEYDDTQIVLSKTIKFEPSLGYLINNVLSDNQTRQAVLGLNNETLNLLRPVALVTGITSDKADSWAIGYTPQLVVGTHVGRADRLPFSADPFALQSAGPIWRAVMAYAHDRDALPPQDWPRPNTVTDYIVCEKSGMIPNPQSNCQTRTETLPSGIQLPIDTFWKTFEVNSQTRQLATANTPNNLREKFVYFVPPPEAMDWWVSNGQPLPPTEFDTLSLPEVLQSVQILRPTYFEYIGGTVDIRGSIETENFQYYQLSYGEGVDPKQWFEIGGQQTVFTPGTSLGLWDTTGLDGVYTLWLRVVLVDNSVDSAFVQVSVDNVAPTIALQAGEPGQVFRWPETTKIPLVAEAVDNLAIARVEFYHNGLLLGEDITWPYGFEFPVTRTGLEIFSATVYDDVGNSASSEIQAEITRGGG